MGRLSNLVIAAVAGLLIAVGIAAQTGTVSLHRGGHSHGAVLGSHSISDSSPQGSSPAASPSPAATAPPAAAAAPAPQAPAPPESKKGKPKGGGGGGDGGGD